MLIKLSLSSLRATLWHEYAVRFALGGAVTVLTGLIGARFGTAVGGLFLALPAIFCASGTLVERHERRAKHKKGLRGERRGQQAAALDAAGAGLGSAGLVAFAGLFSVVVPITVPGAFIAALIGWITVSTSMWWLRRKLRTTHRSAAVGRPAQ